MRPVTSLNFILSTIWKDEIKNRASALARFVFKIVAAILVIVTMVAAGIMKAADLKPSWITRYIGNIDNAQTVGVVFLIIAAVLAVCFQTRIIPPLSDWFTPRRMRYRAAAVQIIDELASRKEIDEPTQKGLMDVAGKLLGPLEINSRLKKREKELLCSACKQMAEIISESRRKRRKDIS